MTNNQVYIDKKTTTAMKGIAMLLILLGHNHILCGMKLHGYLYCFHLVVFFTLPMFYNKIRELNRVNVANIIVRNLVPYSLFYVFCYLIYHFVLVRDGFSASPFVLGLLHLGGYSCNTSTGFIFLWFLPVFCWTSIFLLFKNKIGQNVLLFVSIIVLSFFMYDWNKTWTVYFPLIPFYLGRALWYFSLGIVIFNIARLGKNIQYACAGIFAVFSILYLLNVTTYWQIPYGITGFFAVKFLAEKLNDSRLLQLIGDKSMSIYMFHIFINAFLERIVPWNVATGLIVYVMTLLLAIVADWVIEKLGLKKYVFPRGISQFRQKN